MKDRRNPVFFLFPLSYHKIVIIYIFITKVLGWVATFMSVMMYESYFSQIMNNLAGQKGNFIQPLVAVINCSLWVYYGLLKKERDIPLAAANALGIVFGLVTAITALI